MLISYVLGISWNIIEEQCFLMLFVSIQKLKMCASNRKQAYNNMYLYIYIWIYSCIRI